MLVSIVTMTEAYPEIWDNFTVPDHVDRQTAIDAILIGCAELELLYSDPDILKYIIGAWTRKELPVWTELQKTLEYKYNPIANVEADEREERTLTGDHNRTPNLTSTQSVQGYNSDQWAGSSKLDSTGSETYNIDDKEVTVKHREGNIGVTMTQQLIKAQRDIVMFTVTEFIFNSFKSNFCLMVY